MILKICIGKDIRKISNHPASLSDLKQFIRSSYSNNGTDSIMIQYMDNSGNTRIITTEDDYKALINSNLNNVKLTIDFIKPQPELTNAKNFDYDDNLSKQPDQKSSLPSKANPSYEKKGFKNLNEVNPTAKGDNQRSSDPQEEIKLDDSSGSSDNESHHRHHHDDYKHMYKHKNKAEKEEKRKLRIMLKSQHMREIFTDVIFDTLPLMADVLATYIRNPGEDMTDKVRKSRPSSKLPELEAALKLGKHHHFSNEEQADMNLGMSNSQGMANPYYKKLCRELAEELQKLPENSRGYVNEMLGGVPEKIAKAVENSEKSRDKKKCLFHEQQQQQKQAYNMSGSAPIDGKLPWRSGETKGEDIKKNQNSDFKKKDKEKYKDKKQREDDREPTKEPKEYKDKEPKESKEIKDQKEKDKEKKDKKKKEKELQQQQTPLIPSLPEKQQQQKDPQIEIIPEKKLKKDKSKGPKPEGQYNFQLVKQSNTIPSPILPDPGKIIYKNISLKNTGLIEWPNTTFISPRDGSAGKEALLTQLSPEKELATIVSLYNPGRPGKYSFEWALAYRNLEAEVIQIGQPFNIDFEVIDPRGGNADQEKAEKKEEPLSREMEQLVSEMQKILSTTSKDKLIGFIRQNPGVGIDILVQKYLSEETEGES